MSKCHRISVVLLAGLCAGIISCGSENPVSTNPINDGISGTRIATPRGQTFSELDSGKDPVSKSVVASFTFSPDDLSAAAEGGVELLPDTMTPCLDCAGLAIDERALAALAAAEDMKEFGSFLPDDLAITFNGRIPDTNPVGEVELSVRFQLSTLTQLINPGGGVRFEVVNAVLQDAETDPQQMVEAEEISDPIDFNSKEITQGQSNTKPVRLTFGTAEFDSRVLKLDVRLTSPIPGQESQRGKVRVPGDEQLYHGVTFDPQVASFNPDQLKTYTTQVGKPAAWVALTQRWDQDRSFPTATATQIQQSGSVPYLRLVLPDPLPPEAPEEQVSPLQPILEGETDEDWQTWARAIQNYGFPVMVAIGYLDPLSAAVETPEATAEREAVYQYIIQQVRQQDIPNLLWVYHPNINGINSADGYPGDEFIDWIGFDLYAELSDDANAPLNSDDIEAEDSVWQPFQAKMDQVYPKVAAVSSSKPVVLAALGFPSPPEPRSGSVWVRAAVRELAQRRWPRVVGFTWDESTTTLGTAPELAPAFQDSIGVTDVILGQVLTGTADTLASEPITPDASVITNDGSLSLPQQFEGLDPEAIPDISIPTPATPN